ncbi:MAG: hypothetical protein KC731_31150 [Myxococcales bacterium]|nr:hypothetical protein [Myxococcales bacterium]
MSPRFPPARPHGELREIFDDVFFVTGTVEMAGPLPMRFSRNMTVIRSGRSLCLVNSVRLDDAGLEALTALGDVDHVVRLAGFHGMDDPFYQDRFKAKVWAIEGQTYATGFANQNPDPKTYFSPDAWLTADGELPIDGARLQLFPSARVPEGLLHLDREGGIVIAGDALQNWAAPDEYFSLPARLMMRLMGFFKPLNVGPGWLRGARPGRDDLRAILDTPFEHVLPSHGAPVIGDARERYRPAVERATR